jgi:hypothetical protein
VPPAEIEIAQGADEPSAMVARADSSAVGVKEARRLVTFEAVLAGLAFLGTPQ